MSIEKFKVGDKVVLRSDMIVGERYGGRPLFQSMKEFTSGCELEVCEVVEKFGWYVLLKADCTRWPCFTDEMLEPCASYKDIEVNDESINEFLKGWLKDVNRKI